MPTLNAVRHPAPALLLCLLAASTIEAEAACGDGVWDLDLGEQCDDGGVVAGDGCSTLCLYEPVGQSCGDSVPGPLEVCDDGNLVNGDACNPTCNFANSTSLFAGAPGSPGLQDGFGTFARFGTGVSTLTTDGTYLWMADTANHAIRRITIATAEVLTVAGNGTAGYVDAQGLSARFNSPFGIATDGTTVWIADGGNRVLRAMSASPPYAVTTVAGSPSHPLCPFLADGIGTAASFDSPRGMVYSGGYVYVLDTAALRRFNPATQEVVTVAGTACQTGTTDGIGTTARFVSPRYLTLGNSGMLYIADTQGAKIRTFNMATAEVGTLAGNGTQGYVDGSGAAVRVHRPRGLAFDGTSVYWVEGDQDTVRQMVLPTGQVGTQLGTHCNGAAVCNGAYVEGIGTAARFNLPTDVLFHFPTRSLFVFDAANAVLRRVQ